MTLLTLTPPSVEPLAIDDAVTKAHLRADDFDDDDTTITAYIAAARAHVEAYTRRRMITQTVRLTLDGFGCGAFSAIPLPIAPVQSVDQVQYQDGDGAWQTLAPSAYAVSRSHEPPRLVPAYGMTWPVPRRDVDVVRIDLVVGYGAAGSDVEPALLQAMRMLIAFWYGPAGREAASMKLASETPLGVKALLDPHRLWI